MRGVLNGRLILKLVARRLTDRTEYLAELALFALHAD
jgi:hypothetical protein